MDILLGLVVIALLVAVGCAGLRVLDWKRAREDRAREMRARSHAPATGDSEGSGKT